MKKIIFTIAILCSFTITRACDICGCGLGNYYFGFLPQFEHKFLGVKYEFRNFHTVLKDDPSEFSRDHYTTITLWGGWNIGKRWQVLAMLPYNYVHQVSDEGTVKNSGIGDIAVLGNYKLLDRTSATSNKKLVTQLLWIGAGIKAPTGKFNIDAAADDLIAKSNIQTGSGSTDILVNTLYNVRIDKWGINTVASYKINTRNSDKYHFGDKFSASTFASYAAKKNKTTFLPNIGLMYEHSAANTLQGEKVDQTGGYIFAAAAGLEVNIKKITVGANVQLPAGQHFAEGQTVTNVRGMAHITFSL